MYELVLSLGLICHLYSPSARYSLFSDTSCCFVVCSAYFVVIVTALTKPMQFIRVHSYVHMYVCTYIVILSFRHQSCFAYNIIATTK